MFTIKPRAVSRVCRTALNCLSSWARNAAFSASACLLLYCAIEIGLVSCPLCLIFPLQAICFGDGRSGSRFVLHS
jgi:hypothetical protein